MYFRALARGAYNEYGAWRAMCVCVCVCVGSYAVGASPGLRSLAPPSLSGRGARSNLCIFAIYIVCVREREGSATPTNRRRPLGWRLSGYTLGPGTSWNPYYTATPCAAP